MKHSLPLALALILILAFTGCVVGKTATRANTAKEPWKPLQDGLFAEQILSGSDGDIHYSYYLPQSHNGRSRFPLMVVMPCYDMMWFGENSSGRNLSWSGFTSWTKLDTEMIVVSAQLTLLLLCF